MDSEIRDYTAHCRECEDTHEVEGVAYRISANEAGIIWTCPVTGTENDDTL